MLRLSPYYLAIRAYHHARLLRARLRPPSPWEGVRILGYHRIANVPDVLCVRPTSFRAQLESLLADGVQPIRLDAALGLLDGPVAGRFFCVTLDDGYRDNLEHGLPVLEDLGVPATIYLPIAIVDGSAGYFWYEDPPPALGWDEVLDIHARGLVDFQPHTRTHAWLPQLSDEEATAEIAGSKRDLEARLGFTATSFCYPAGLYGPREAALVRGAGYLGAVTMDPGVNTAETPKAALKRTMVYWEDSPRAFAAKVSGALDKPPILRYWLYKRRSSGKGGLPMA